MTSAGPRVCPDCRREDARLARHQAAIMRGQDHGESARVLEAYATQLERLADADEERTDKEPTDPGRRVVSLRCPNCRYEMLAG